MSLPKTKKMVVHLSKLVFTVYVLGRFQYNARISDPRGYVHVIYKTVIPDDISATCGV